MGSRSGPGAGRRGRPRLCLKAPTLVAESTQRMLAQMRAVLDREAARLGADGSEGKAAVDQVSLIARTLEKIDQMERLIAEDQARATGPHAHTRRARAIEADRAATHSRGCRAAGGGAVGGWYGGRG